MRRASKGTWELFIPTEPGGPPCAGSAHSKRDSVCARSSKMAGRSLPWAEPMRTSPLTEHKWWWRLPAVGGPPVSRLNNVVGRNN
jgi:hypothetical protein